MTFDPNQLYACSLCGAVKVGAWPHPYEQPCPQKEKVDQAYIEMLDAQRMSYIRSASSAEGMADAIRHATGVDDDDD